MSLEKLLLMLIPSAVGAIAIFIFILGREPEKKWDKLVTICGISFTILIVAIWDWFCFIN